MFLVFDLKFFFIDEFVVGMIDDEMYCIGEFFFLFVGKYIIVVVEYDMGFVCQIVCDGKVIVFY